MKRRRFTDEEIQRANDVSIVDYIKKLNLETKKAGRTLKLEGFGGLYVDPRENKWNCFAEGKGGGPIQLVMYLENKTWVESIKTLLGDDYKDSLIDYKKKPIEKEYKEFTLPKKNNTYNHMLAYLIKTRCIDKDIVYGLINNKKIYEDEKRNCVFLGYDQDNNIKYAGLRGTNTNRVFKGEVEGSNKAYSFNIKGETNRVKVFESPIEIMSYLTLQKNKGLVENHHMVSLGCLADVALVKYLEDNPNINEIDLCLNNDKWGIKATGEIKEKYKKDYKVNIEVPGLEDWNNDLVYSFQGLEKTDNTIEIEEETCIEL